MPMKLSHLSIHWDGRRGVEQLIEHGCLPMFVSPSQGLLQGGDFNRRRQLAWDYKVAGFSQPSTEFCISDQGREGNRRYPAESDRKEPEKVTGRKPPGNKRNDQAFERGTFRRRGDTIEIFPAHYEDRAWRVSLFGDEIENIWEFDSLTGEKKADELMRPYVEQTSLKLP